jgi:hypothetical protein
MTDVRLTRRLVAVLALGPSAVTRPEWADLTGGDDQLEDLLQLARREKVLPSVARCLIDRWPDRLPQHVGTQLVRVLSENATCQRVYLDELREVRASTDGELIVVKGLSFQHAGWEGLPRHFRDMDVLVPETETGWQVVRSLYRLGYEPGYGIAMRCDAGALRFWPLLERRLGEGDRVLEWEVNVGAFPITSFSALPAAAVAATASDCDDLAGASGPDPATCLLVLCAEALSRSRLSVRDNLDLALLIARHRNDIDWARTLRRFHEMALDRVLRRLVTATGWLRDVLRGYPAAWDSLPAQLTGGRRGGAPGRALRFDHLVRHGRGGGWRSRAIRLGRQSRLDVERRLFDSGRLLAAVHRINRRRDPFRVLATGGLVYLVPLGAASTVELDLDAVGASSPPSGLTVETRWHQLLGCRVAGQAVFLTPAGAFLASVDCIVDDSERASVQGVLEPLLSTWSRA